jgi:hypothetical protein
VFERVKMVHALGRAASVIGFKQYQNKTKSHHNADEMIKQVWIRFDNCHYIFKTLIRLEHLKLMLPHTGLERLK